MVRLTFINLWQKGGMLHYSCHLGKALSELDDVELTLVLPKGAKKDLIPSGVSIKYVDVPFSGGLAALPGNLIRLMRIREFLKTVKETRPDVIHINSSHVWIALTIRALKKLCPIVATVHDAKPHPGENTLRKRIEKGSVLRHANQIVVHSNTIRKELLGLVRNRQNEEVFVTPRGPYQSFGSAEDCEKQGDPTILFFGRVLEYKGLKYLLQAAPLIREAVPNVRIVVAGEGDIKEYQEVLSDRSLFEVDNSYISDEKVAEYFRRAWLLALPYTEASWSGVASIAQQFSLPIVSTKVGCLPELVREEVNGILVEPGDSEALAQAIIRILTDPEKRSHFQKNAKLLQTENWNIAASALRGLYRKLVVNNIQRIDIQEGASQASQEKVRRQQQS